MFMQKTRGKQMAKQFRDFESVRELARGLKLSGQREWAKYCKSGNKPDDIPSDPSRSYKNKGWVNWGDFLGTNRVAVYKKNFLPFEEARKFVHSLKIKGQIEWREYCNSGNKPDNITSSPYLIYKNKGWKGYGDWLGTGNIANFEKQFRDFNSAREFVRKLGLKEEKEWKEYSKSSKRPEDIPSRPERTYKNKGWNGYSDFLGTEKFSKFTKMDFKTARKFARSLKLKSIEDWKRYCSSGYKPKDIPNSPHQSYMNEGWIDWGDWLDVEIISSREISKQYLSFKEARKEARILSKKYNIQSWTDWNDAVKKGLIPKNIPVNPWRTYRKNSRKENE